MPNTTYEGTKPMAIRKVNDTQSVVSEGRVRNGNYKKYGLKEYNQLQANMQSNKMGGLGANIGGEQWE